MRTRQIAIMNNGTKTAAAMAPGTEATIDICPLPPPVLYFVFIQHKL